MGRPVNAQFLFLISLAVSLLIQNDFILALAFQTGKPISRLIHQSYIIITGETPRFRDVRMEVSYPVKIKNVISKLTASTQKALRDRKSRMEIELPPGVLFGVETTPAKKSESNSDKIKRSNREAARLITEMFSILSSSTVVLFPSEDEAFAARNIWGPTFRGKTISMDVSNKAGFGKLRSRRFTLEEQEQALFSSDGGVYVRCLTIFTS